MAPYGARPHDKYSLADCISMQTKRKERLTEVLTNNRHFEGFHTPVPGFISLLSVDKDLRDPAQPSSKVKASRRLVVPAHVAVGH